MSLDAITVLVPSTSDAKRVGARLRPADSVQVWRPETPGEVPDGHVLFLRRPRTYEHLPRIALIRSLRLVQVFSIGHEWLDPRIHPRAVVANGEGTGEVSAAEVAVMHVLGSLKRVERFSRDRRRRLWDTTDVDTLAGSAVAVVGAGGVGSTVARYLRVFEPASVRVFARSGRTLADGTAVEPLASLADALPHTDIVVVALPLTEATRHLVDAEFLAKLPTGAHLVNVGRGGVVATDALRDALAQRRIWAACDVVDPEPLPPDDPLWAEERLLLTPHVGGNTRHHEELGMDLLVDQVERLRDGRPLRNVRRAEHHGESANRQVTGEP